MTATVASPLSVTGAPRSSRTRVILFTLVLDVGGVERNIERLARGLDPSRFEPIVAWSSQWGAIGDRLRLAGVPVVHLPVRSESGYREAVATLRGLEADIFHSFNYRKDARDVLAAREAGIPVILTGRVNIRQWDPLLRVQDWELERNRVAHRIVAVGNVVADVCASVEGVSADEITVIHNGVEIPDENEATPAFRRNFPADATVIGFVANYRPEKDHRTLLHALRLVLDRRPDAYLLCCGYAKGIKEELEGVVRELGIEERVKLLDSQESMSDVYCSLDLYVHSSTHEGFSIAIVEAMAYGLPVVATSVGGNPEAVLDGVTGVLVPPKDPARLAEAISALLSDPDRRQRFGRAGRERAIRHFSLEAMLEKHARLYESFQVAQPHSEPPAAINGESVLPPRTHTAEIGPSNGSPSSAGLPASVEYKPTATRQTEAETTIFVTTIGDQQHFCKCIDHLRSQSVVRPLEIIDHVGPMSAALQQMIDRCNTPFYVQVDEDMALFPDAIKMLECLMKQASPDVALICAYLWDCETQQAIQGVKIYRHAIVKQFPYRDTLSCEIEQIARMKAAGFKITILRPGDRSTCFGEHGGQYTPEIIFKRWQRHFQKHQQMGNMKWIEPWPKRLLERYLESRDSVHLYALLGAVAGITSGAPPDREIDWKETNRALESLQRYFPAEPSGGAAAK
jgi:glycosyltransferase involved in cell wall biosynthesis